MDLLGLMVVPFLIAGRLCAGVIGRCGGMGSPPHGGTVLGGVLFARLA